MVKTRSPLMSHFASGTIGGELTFSATARGTTIRKTPRRSRPLSESQLASTAWMRWLIREWNTLSPPDEATWDWTDDETTLSPYHRFLKTNSLRWAHNHGPSRAYPATDAGPVPGTPSALIIYPGIREIRLRIDQGAPQPTWGWMIHRTTVHFPDSIPSTLRAILSTVAVQTNWFDTAEPGIEYYYMVRGFNVNGTLGLPDYTHAQATD